MSKQRVLVLGASGYIGSQLIPQLLEQGFEVTAAARQIQYLHSRVSAHKNLQLCYLDLADPELTQQGVQGFDVIFFLVHGMSHGDDFIDYELSLAQNLKTALIGSSTKHLIFLSSLQAENTQSQHLLARKQTGEVLRQLPFPVTELRAGVVIGAGSAAFEIMRDFTYNLPLIVAPKSIASKANPIAIENLNYYLLCLCRDPALSHRTFEVGGPDNLSYKTQLQTIAKQTNHSQAIWGTRLLTPRIAAHWLGLITSVPSSIGSALLGGLEHDFLANSQAIQDLYPQQLIGFEEAVSAAIKHEGDFVKSNVWGFDPSALRRWQPGYGYFPKQAGASVTTKLSAEQLWAVIKRVGQPDQGYFFANILWRTREWMDPLFGGGRPIRRTPKGDELQVGDHIDSWKVIRCDKNQFISLLFGMKAPGLGRLEFLITDHGDHRELNVTAWWHPKGFAGLLYWFAMMPAHLFIFKGMVKAICRKSR